MNINHEDGIQDLLDLAKTRGMSPRMRRRLLNGIDKVLRGEIEYLDRIKDLEERLLRNPAFPDDLVGWLDDDFDLSDDEDKDEEE